MKLSTTKGEWKPVKRGNRLFITSATKDEHGVLKNVVDVATVEYVRNSENGLSATEGNASVMAAAPELLEQVKSLSYCFGELLNHSESIPTRLGWDREKLEEWKKELDELVIKAEGK